MRSQDHSKIKPGKAIPRPTISPETSSLSAETSPKIVEHKSARNSTSTIESDDTDIDLSGISPDLRIKCPISHDVKTDVTTNTTFSSSMETRGYSELASLIASSPSQTSTIFRRFDKMNMRNLLILENEIADLERRLEHLEFSKTKTMESNVGVKIQSTGEKANKIKEIGLQLKEKVKEYYEGILLTKEMLALSRPNQKSLNATRRMVTNRRAGSPLDFIAGPMAQHLSPKYENDLSVLSPEMEDDFIKRFFNGKFIVSNVHSNRSQSLKAAEQH
jgi:hypothetical protein